MTQTARQDRRRERLEGVQAALAGFATQPLKTQTLREAALNFWTALGYGSPRTAELSFADLLENAPQEGRGNLAGKLKALEPEVSGFELLFQLTTEDVRAAGQPMLMAGQYDQTNIESYLFVAVRLKDDKQPARKDLADMARTLNRAFRQPVLTLFITGQGTQTRLSLTAVQRRVNKREAEKDVLGKVTLVYDVDTAGPRRSLDILTDLHLDELLVSRDIRHFAQLERAWADKFAVEALNRRFYQELSNWFYWAAAHPGVSFPDERGGKLSDKERTELRQRHLIRLITRLMFVWFLREKDLVPLALFQEKDLKRLLKEFDPQSKDSSDFYQAILQNLFFATLNTEMGENRKFLGQTKGGYNPEHGIPQVYRYPELFKDEGQALAAFATVPFLNGGLFECLDVTKDKEAETPERKIDGFSAVDTKRARIPNEVFFLESERPIPRLNEVYGIKNKSFKVRGLITLLSAYKFTTTENTPVEEEVALDPELLGKVFENLLAAVVEETQDTARKKTGSFYTPRYVVDDMTDDALLTYFGRVMGGSGDMPERLALLLAYTPEKPSFNDEESRQLVKGVNELDILDPACGSGAFPMGVLQKLVHVLGRVDPDNKLWIKEQREPVDQEIERLKADQNLAGQISEVSVRNKAIEDLEKRKTEIDKAFNRDYANHDYARKLFLIENCIYGVDLQPIAVQISKLRCFISLVVDQHTGSGMSDNRGILPLPNLESQFVAANTLGKVGQDASQSFADSDSTVIRLRAELAAVRHEHFLARKHRAKKKLREQDRAIRKELADELGKFPGTSKDDARQLANFDPYDQNASAGFFDAKWMFNLDGGKFDIVIGNPPYVRQERIKEQKPQLKTNYQSVYDGKADLFVYFFARGLELLKPGGVLTYICSNKFFRSGYGKNLRTQLAQKTLTRIIDFGDAPVFDAIAYPSILAVQEAEPADAHQTRALNWNPEWQIDEYRAVMAVQAFDLAQSSLKPDGWQVEGQAKLKLLEQLRGVGQPLGEYVGGRFYRGILTGLNEAFVVNRETRDALIAEDPKSAEVLKPYLRGRDVKRWVVDSPDLWLIFTRRGIKINDYLAIKKHLQQYRKQLEPGGPGGRKEGSYKWYEIQDNIAYFKEFEGDKIIYPDISDSNNFTLDQRFFYPDCTLFLIPQGSKEFLVLLNSKLLNWFFAQISPKIRGGYMRYKSLYVSNLPIADMSTEQRNTLVHLSDALLLLASQPQTPSLALSVAYFERVLDALVYELYLPHELHSLGYEPFAVISAHAWPELSGDTAQDLAALDAVFTAWYDPQHPIRQLTYYLDSVPAVRIIEGKEETGAAGSGADA